MNRYLVKIIFNIIVGEDASQFDEQFHLVTAESEEDAFAKGENIGRQEEEIFRNDKDETVHWKFTGTENVYPLPAHEKETLVFSTTRTEENPQEHFRRLKKKSHFHPAQPTEF